MFLIYNENEKPGKMAISDLDPAMMYMKHADNWMFLKFIILRSDNTIEKIQATKEISIAERKMKYWYTKINDVSTITQPVIALKKKWDYGGNVYQP